MAFANLLSESRLQVLRSSGLLDSAAELAFDRLTRLAVTLVGAPVALVSLVDDHRQFFKSAMGLAEPWASRRETPLTHSFCKLAVETREALIVPDAREHPDLRHNLAIQDLGVIAYAGVPLVVDDEPLGAFCVIDDRPRAWTAKDVTVLEDLAGCVVSEIELRRALRAAHEQRALLEALVDGMADAVLAIDTRGTFLMANQTARRVFPVAEVGKEAPLASWPSATRSRRVDGTPLAPEDGPLVRAMRGLETDGLVITQLAPNDGQARWMEATGRPVRDENGAVTAGVAVFRDITARMRQESLYSFLFAQSPLGIVISDAEGRLVDANPAAVALYERPREEMLGKTSADLGLLTAEARQVLLERVREKGRLLNEEVTAYRPSGEARDVYMSVQAVDVGARLYVTTFLDETERRVAERRYKQIVETTREGIVVTNATGRYVFANARAEDMLRFGPGELLGKHVLDIIAREDLDQARNILEQRRQGIHGDDEIRILRKDGSTFWAQIAASPVEGKTAGYHGTLSMVHDVTDRRQARESLAREHALLTAMLTHSGEGVALLDRDFHILFANPAYERIFGLSRDQLLRIDRDGFFEHLVSLADGDRDAFRERLRERRGLDEDYVFKRPRRRVLRRSEVALELPEGGAFLVTWRDVTAERDLLAERDRQLLVDALTGIANRRAAEAALVVEDARRKRAGGPLGVAILDVDHFKRVNDSFGHAAGDEVLRIVASTVAAQARLTDVIARWGGEEFLAILPGDLEGAFAFGERARSAIEGVSFPGVGRVTISVGVAELAPGETPSTAIARADERLYAAKRAGRNRVEK